MRVKCENCAAGYTLPASKLKPGRRVQFACRRCDHRIVIAVPEAAASAPASRSRVGASPEVTGARAPQPASSIRRGVGTGGEPARRTTGGAKRRVPRRDPAGRHLSTRTPRATGAKASAPKTTTEPQVKWFVANPDGSHQRMLETEFRAKIESGDIGGDALVWRKGWPEWRPVDQAAEWQPVLARLAATHAARITGPKKEDEPAAAEISSTRLVQMVEEQEPEPTPEPEPALEPGPEPEESPSLDVAADSDPELEEDAELPDDALLTAEPEAKAPVEGLEHLKHSQRAVSLPIVRVPTSGKAVAAVRPKPLRSLRQTTSPNDSSLQRKAAPSSSRFATGRPATGTPIDGPQDEDALDSAWAPATDTYIGPRDRFTRRLGSDEQRQELLARVDRERSVLRQLRFWQWTALGCACAAIMAFSLTVYAMISLRIAESELKHLPAQRPAPTAVTSPDAPTP